MEQEKIFNLQLIIQKLEEQLSVYRNGTTGPELLDVIAERETENTALKKELSETKDQLRKIAKSSSELIQKFDDNSGCNQNWQKRKICSLKIEICLR
jgi:Tfp pilus assembly protein PilN